MNAIDFLINEHNKVRTMLADISDGSLHYDTKRRQFNLLSQELIRHENMEHEIWYPYFKDKIASKVKHLITEEQYAERAIKKLDDLKTEEDWEENFLRFKNAVERHADEEENDLFPEVKKILTNKQLEEIGMKMSQFKDMQS